MAECTKGWYERCRKATSRKCRCSCGGTNHGGLVRGAMDNVSMVMTERNVYNLPVSFEFVAMSFEEIVFQRDLAGDIHTNVVRQYVYHSLTGFDWGYMGSGPSDLALNILGMYIPGYWAFKYHQQFKVQFVAPVPDAGGTISAAEIVLWIKERMMEEANDTAE